VVSEHRAHQLSGLIGVGALAAYLWTLQRRWPIPSAREALKIGAAWAVLTVGFEFSFGGLVADQSWDELLEEYNVAGGHTWPFVLPGSRPALR
jgi:hypothetical protein